MIVITGGSGYVGSHIVKKLVESGTPVRAMVRSLKTTALEGRLAHLDIELVKGDVTQAPSLEPVFQGATVVIHTVAIAIEKGGLSYENINARGTQNVIQAAKEAGVRRFVNLSQLGADSRLPYRFLASKGLAQDYVVDSGLDWTAFRPSVIWGPEDEFANTFAKLVPLTPIIFPIIDKRVKFQPVWVEDVASAVVKSLEDPSTFQKEYELGGPEILTMEEIERRVLTALGTRRFLIPIPRPILRGVVTLMEAVLPQPPVTRSLLELLAVDNVTKNNAINQFVTDPRPFTPDNARPYMKEVRVGATLAQFFGK